MLATAIAPGRRVPTFAFLALELRRALRNRRYVFLGIALPIFFYLLSTTGERNDDPTWRSVFMISMACYGAIISGLSGAVIIAQERAGGWTRQLRVTPLPPVAYVIGKLVVAYLVMLPAIVAVLLAGLIVNHVALPAASWLEIGALLAVGALPFCALGLVIGSTFDQATAQMATTISMFGLAIVGGLWVPLSLLPDPVQAVGHLLPSYHLGNLGWSIVTGYGVDPVDLLVLLAWAVALGGLAWWRFRAAERRSDG
jgi:ABC-2 type transport system permease protein